ncbi:MAG: histidine phosphatase family protein [Terriglobales bacterium]
MGRLILVRHGHTPLNRPGDDERLRAWLDVPLDETGIEEAVKTAEMLTKYPVEAIYCSDLRRARQTAEVLRRRVKAPVIATSELRPWNLGAFGGQRVRDLLPFLNLLNQRPDLAAPSGESFYQFYGRYSHRLHELLRLAEATEGCVLAVTHVRNLLAATTIIEGGDRNKVPVKGGPSTGTISIVEKVRGVWKIHRDDGREVVQQSRFSSEDAAAAPAVECAAAQMGG